MDQDQEFRRLWSVAAEEKVNALVYRFPDKDYESWLGGFGYKNGIDFTYPDTLLDRVAAGIISYQARMSLQTALKYAQKGESRLDRLPRFDRLFQVVSDLFLSKFDDFFRLDRPTLADPHGSYVHAELFLWRTLSAFKGARTLINRGFLAEPAAVLRTALEQVAWCYAVSINADAGQLEHRDPPKCIAQLRKFRPGSARLYGLLSNLGHMDFDAQKHFVSAKGDFLGITFQSTEFKAYGVLCYLLVMALYSEVARQIIAFYRRDYRQLSG